MKKICMFIAVIFMLVTLPFAVFASAVSAEEEIPTSGELGDGFSWEAVFDEERYEYNLYINGSGRLPSPAELGLEEYPWQAYAEYNKYKWVIGEGITVIPSGMFSDYSLSISFPESLERIETGAIHIEGTFSLKDNSVYSVYEENCITWDDGAMGLIVGYVNGTCYEFALGSPFSFYGFGHKYLNTFEDGSGFTYEMFDDHAMLIEYTGTDESIVVPSSADGRPVTVIGDTVFSNAENLTKVEIPDTVTTMLTAFDKCESLTDVIIPPSVTELIGTFRYCSGLTEVTIPDTVVTMQGTFFNCENLTTVHLPDSVTDITGAFQRCSSLKEITLPSSLTEVSVRAFAECTALEIVNIPDSVTSIGQSAFYRCNSLKTITLPDSVTTIDNLAFSSCDSLKTVTLPASLTEISASVFSSSTSLEEVNITGDVTSIGMAAFLGCTSLKNITLPETVEVICENAFWESGLTSIDLPAGIKTVEQHAFYSCQSLEAVTYPDTIENVAYEAFEETPVYLTLTFPDSTNVILNVDDDHTTTITDPVIPDCVTSMYYNSINMKGTLTIGSRLREFKVNKFDSNYDYYDSLKDIVVSEDNPYFCAEKGVLYNKDKTEIIYIARDYEFEGGIMTIPASVEKISCKLFNNSVRAYEVENGNTAFAAADGVLFDAQMKTLISYPTASPTKYYTVPSGTEAMLSGAFFVVPALTAVEIPASVNTLQWHTFENAETEYIIFWHSSDDPLEIDFVFEYDGRGGGKDTTYYVLKGSIIEETFPYRCAVISPGENGTLGENISWVTEGLELRISGTGAIPQMPAEEYPWYGIAFESLIFEGENIEIPDNAFEGNEYILSADLSGVTSIGERAFYECEKLINITGDESVSIVKAEALEGTRWIAGPRDESGLNILGNVFMKAFSADEIVIPENVTYIPDDAFTAASIDTLYVPESGVFWNRYAFRNSIALNHLRFIGREEDITVEEFRAAAEKCRNVTLTDQNGNVVTGKGCASDNTLMQLADAVSETAFMDRIRDEFCRGIAEKMGCSSEMTDMELITAIYDYCMNNVSYQFWYTETPDGTYSDGESTWEMSTNLSHQSTGIVVTDSGVCSAYSEIVNTFVSILQEDGISSTIRSTSNTGKGHEWNAVGLDVGTENEKWYYLDLANKSYLLGYEDPMFELYPETFSYDPSIPKNEDGTYTVTLQNGTVINMEADNVERPEIKGDVNDDLAVNLDDASAILKIYASIGAGIDSGYSEAETAAADVDENGAVTLDDASAVLSYYARKGAGLEADWDDLIAV